MIERTLAQVAEATGGITSSPRVRIDAVATDSRRLPSGEALFVALPGEHADGHDFAADAVAAGARAILVERHPEGVDVPAVVVDDTWAALLRLGTAVREEIDPVVVAITGSVGKTTVKDLTAAAVGAGRITHAAHGSHNNELGVPVTLLGIEDSTEVLVAELGARRPGDIAQLAVAVAPDLAVVTAVAEVHLELFGSIEAVAATKGELVSALGPDGVAVLNATDPRVAAMADRAPAVISVALDDPRADVHARDLRLDRRALPRATAHTPWGRVELRLAVAGRHNVGNALFALAVAGHLGVDLDAAAEAMASAPVSPWRGEIVESDGVTVLNDAYNANPVAMAAALETLQAIERTGRSWAVLGVMAEIGPTARQEHLGVGHRCAQLGVDRVVAVGAGAAAIAEGAREAGLDDERVAGVADADAALALLRAAVEPGDVVLVKASRVAGLERVGHGLVGATTPAEADR